MRKPGCVCINRIDDNGKIWYNFIRRREAERGESHGSENQFYNLFKTDDVHGGVRMCFRSRIAQIKTPGKCTAVALFLLGMICVSQTISPAGEGNLFCYKIGFLAPWLTVYSDETNRFWTFDLLFGGNSGVHINIAGLLFYCLLVLVAGIVVQLLWNRIFAGSSEKQEKGHKVQINGS